jgi:hypothetical protein
MIKNKGIPAIILVVTSVIGLHACKRKYTCRCTVTTTEYYTVNGFIKTDSIKGSSSYVRDGSTHMLKRNEVQAESDDCGSNSENFQKGSSIESWSCGLVKN